MRSDQVNAVDPHIHPYVRPVGAVPKDKLKSAVCEPFVVGSALEKPEDGAGFDLARRESESPPGDEVSSFEEIFAVAYEAPTPASDSDAVQPEDSLDAQDLCAFLEAAAHP